MNINVFNIIKNNIGYSVDKLREKHPLLGAFIFQAPSNHRIVKAFKQSENPPENIINELKNMDDTFTTFLLTNDIHYAKRNASPEDEHILNNVIYAENFDTNNII